VSARIGLPTSSVCGKQGRFAVAGAHAVSRAAAARDSRQRPEPGPVETPAFINWVKRRGAKSLAGDIANLVPLGRMGTPTELAKAALYLASDESSYTVGTELLVDGGTGSL
jgi:NAD(P)-dependent dehydrogenase (short-subunit alcohol dehydrogenase family)